MVNISEIRIRSLFIVKMWILLHATVCFQIVELFNICTVWIAFSTPFCSFLVLQCHRQSSYETIRSKTVLLRLHSVKTHDDARLKRFSPCGIHTSLNVKFVEIEINADVDIAFACLSTHFAEKNRSCVAKRGCEFRNAPRIK